MFVTYSHCPARPEQYGNDAAGFHDAAWLIAADYIEELSPLCYETAQANECLWIVPGTAGCLL